MPDELGWYDFLYDKYFRWKYTAANRHATTTINLERYLDLNQLNILFDIKQRLLKLNLSDVKTALLIPKEIRGMGIAGASGLLSLMYPHTFASVDQFVLKFVAFPSFNSDKHEYCEVYGEIRGFPVK